MSGPCRRRFMSCRAMAFIMIVLNISLTRRRALRMPGMKPQAAPAMKPARQAEGISIQPLKPGKARGSAVPAMAPTMICPSPPMLMTLARKAMHMPEPTRRRGVAFTSVWVRPKVEPTAPWSRAPYAVRGFTFKASSMSAPMQSAATSPAKGMRTVRATFPQSTLGIRLGFIVHWLYHSPFV
jgi:hypothetical protein